MVDLELLRESVQLARLPVETGCNLIRDLLGEPCRIAGNMLADQIYAWQWQNRIRIAVRASEIIEQQQIARRVLPPGFLLPLLEAAGNVEDPDLQHLWASLLASAVGDDSSQHPLYIATLRGMDGADARLLRRLALHATRETAITVPAEAGDDRSAARLIALGLLFTGYANPKREFGPTHIFLSELGFQLVEVLGMRRG